MGQQIFMSGAAMLIYQFWLHDSYFVI